MRCHRNDAATSVAAAISNAAWNRPSCTRKTCLIWRYSKDWWCLMVAKSFKDWGFFLLDPSDIPTYLGLSEVAGGSKFSSELLPKKKEERSNRKPRVFLRCGRCRNGSMRFKLQIGNSALRRLTPQPWRIMGGQGDGAILEWKRCLHRRFRFLSTILGRFGFCITRPTQICTAEMKPVVPMVPRTRGSPLRVYIASFYFCSTLADGP